MPLSSGLFKITQIKLKLSPCSFKTFHFWVIDCDGISTALDSVGYSALADWWWFVLRRRVRWASSVSIRSQIRQTPAIERDFTRHTFFHELILYIGLKRCWRQLDDIMIQSDSLWININDSIPNEMELILRFEAAHSRAMAPSSIKIHWCYDQN